MPPVELSRRAQRDLRGLDPQVRPRVIAALREDLAADPPPPNLDVKTLQGRAPWRRLRVGEHRVLFRPEGDGLLVARVVDRRDLDRAVRGL